jgi:hypothetical protein
VLLHLLIRVDANREGCAGEWLIVRSSPFIAVNWLSIRSFIRWQT